MLNVYVVYKCKPGKGAEFLKKIDEYKIADAVRCEDGCIKYDYYPKYDNPDEVLLIEKWESLEKQQIHVAQPHMAKLRDMKDEYVCETVIGKFETSEF